MEYNTKEGRMMENQFAFTEGAYRHGKPMVLSHQDREFYEENGYLVVKGIWSFKECDEIMEYLNFYKDARGAAMMNLDREYALSRFWVQNYAQKHEIDQKDVPVDKIPF